MKLNLRLFEQQVDPTILQRGLKYFKADRVDEIGRSDDGKEIEFTVVGSEPYHVHLSLDGDEVTDYSCNCPYDMGPVCKHVVAAMFELQQESFTDYEEVCAPAVTSNSKQSKKKAAKTEKKRITAKDIDRILDSLSVDELKNFIRNEISDRAIKMRLVGMYAGRVMPTSFEIYRSQIRSIISEAEGRYGYVEYRDAGQVGREISEILWQAEDNISVGQWDSAWPKIKAVIEEAETIVNCGDDSDGHLGGTVAEAFMILRKIDTDSLPEPLRTELFDYMIGKYESGFLSGWDWGNDFLEIALELADDRSNEFDRIEKCLTIGKYDPSSWREREKLEIMSRLIEKRQSKADAVKFMYEHRANPDFRKRLIESAIASGDYDKAIKLADEGVRSDNDWAGLVNDWNDYKLQVYIRQNDRKSIADTAQRFLTGDTSVKRSTDELYRLIKSNVPAEEWAARVSQLISDIKKSKSYSIHERLRLIYIYEQMWDEYLKLLIANPQLDYLERAEPHFKTTHHAEFVNLYAEAIRLFADQNMGRDSYRQLARYLRRLKKMGDGHISAALAEELMGKYPKRRAMIEELRNI